MGISVTGVQRVLSAQRGKAKKDGVNIAIGLEKCAHTLLRASNKLVPVDTGDLKASGKVEVTGTGFGAKAAVIYDNPYAVYVHEDLMKYHAPPTQARFLAAAVQKVRGNMTTTLGRQLNVGNS